MSRNPQDAEAFLSVILLVLMAFIARDLYSKGFFAAVLYIGWSLGIISSTVILCLTIWHTLEKRRLRASAPTDQSVLPRRVSWKRLLFLLVGGYIIINPFVFRIVNDFPEQGLSIWPLLYSMLLMALLLY